jgi:ubiquinone/menaquinone biosynthesis C-methylase UbiE
MRRYSMPSAGVYDLVTHLLFGRRYDEIARSIAAEAPDGGTLVDLGSGTGEVLMRVSALAPTLHLTGVDIDEEMVARANRKAMRSFPQDSVRRPQFVVADAAALPFPDGSVDLVVSSYAVHHLPDRHAARSEIMRVLKPGGRAIIWDIASPHGQPAPGDAPAHHGGPAPHDASPLDIVRMLLRFGRIPAERYELRKPGAS